MKIILNERKTPHNRRLAQWRVKWLIEHTTSHQHLWYIDSFVLRNPLLRKAANRYASFYKTTVQTSTNVKRLTEM